MATSTVVFRDGTETPVSDAEVKVLHRCGLLAHVAVNHRWHTDADAHVAEVLSVVRERTAAGLAPEGRRHG